jgi:hypothetical protein
MLNSKKKVCMKKIFLIFLAASMFVVACNKDFGDLNVDVKKPAAVPPGTLFSYAQKEMVDLMTNSNVNRNIMRLLAQQWTETTYIDESNYDLATRNIPQNNWNIVYVNVLNNLKESQKLIPGQDVTEVDAVQQKNQNSCAEIMNVYAYSYLINIFGNIPYTEALNIDNVYPKYDDALTVSNDLLTRLDRALSAIDETRSGFGSNDIYFGDDMTAWKRFGTSLKLRLGMMLADVPGSNAKAIVESAAAGAIDKNADNAYVHFFSAPPNTNQIWADLVQSGRLDYVAANTLVDYMDSLADPRIPVFFTNDNAGGYSGGIYGSNNNYSTYSKPATRLIDPTFEATLFDAAETHFLLAEAKERGYTVDGTAAEHYEEAIRASMDYWKVPTAAQDAFLAQPSIAYATAAGDWKQKIGTQKWIAFYNRGYESWTEIRRLDQPKLVAPADANSGYPNRYTYPAQEQNLNTKNWEAASTAVGTDAVETKLFWDKF